MEGTTDRLIQQVDALTEQLRHSSDKFDEAIELQANTVTKLRNRNRLTTGLLAVVTLGLVGIAAAVIISLDASSDANASSKQLAEVLADIEGDRQAQALEVCRIRNAGERANREGRLADIDAISNSLRDLGVDEAPILALEAERRAAVPAAEVTDRDCDGSGVLDANDYPLDGG